MADLNASDILSYEYARRAQELLDNHRKPFYTEADPEIVRDYGYDPDSLAADWLLGTGTGSTAADLALGLTGPLAGPITEAAGGQSGVLDWVPGGSLAKGAAPFLVAKIIRRSPKEAAQAAAREAPAAIAKASGKKPYPVRWRSAEHYLGENDLETSRRAQLHQGLPSRYEDILHDPTEREKRALYVLDSLAGVAARGIHRKRQGNPGNITSKDFQHQWTTYDDAMGKYLTDIEANLESGNLIPEGRVQLMDRFLNTLGREAKVPVLENGTPKPVDLYDMLFKPRSWHRMYELQPKGWRGKQQR